MTNNIKQTVETVSWFANWNGKGVNLYVNNESVELSADEVQILRKGLKKAVIKAAQNAAKRAKEDK